MNCISEYRLHIGAIFENCNLLDFQTRRPISENIIEKANMNLLCSHFGSDFAASISNNMIRSREKNSLAFFICQSI